MAPLFLEHEESHLYLAGTLSEEAKLVTAISDPYGKDIELPFSGKETLQFIDVEYEGVQYGVLYCDGMENNTTEFHKSGHMYYLGGNEEEECETEIDD